MRAAFVAALLGVSNPALAATDTSSELADLKAQMAQMQNRINQLEKAQKEQAAQQQAAAQAVPQPTGEQSRANAFNPAISVVLDGHYGIYSSNNPDLSGFAVGEEGGRAGEGLAIDEAEIGLSSNVDDKFTASAIASLSEEDGETSVELEEAFVRTLGLPYGLGIKAGRFLTPVGYMNDHHTHTDDFADRPLPNRAFLGGAYKDDGVMATWILPTDFYARIGAAVFRGNDFPGGGSVGAGPGAWLAFARTGGDVGDNQSWLAGLSMLQTRPGAREGNDGAVIFHGNSDLYAASLRYIWDPTGNSQQQEVTFQGEYFLRMEDGTYEDTDAATGVVAYNGNQRGWYAQGVYKFAPQWRVGTRYSRLTADGVPVGLAGSALDSGGHDPWNATVMADWTNSEFSRVRLQYSHEAPSKGETDNQLMLQYVMSIGSHPAHTF